MHAIAKAVCLPLRQEFLFPAPLMHFACGNGKVLFEDKFSTLDPAWGFDQESPARTNGPDGLTYKYDPNTSVTLLNQAGLYDDYEVCATCSVQGPPDSADFVSVAFWGSDYDNYYSADVNPLSGWLLLGRSLAFPPEAVERAPGRICSKADRRREAKKAD